MRGGRSIIVAVLIASVVLAGFARQWAVNRRQQVTDNPMFPATVGPSAPASSASLANMDSYALGLMLGGLRGPLVMFLWSTSESQKSARDLDDFDTKVEWIRLLQPEFDSVHLFEIWNKAYNISVQMTNLANKYSTILDALDYANSVDRQRPDDINIIFDVARVFADKLGGSHEAPYYIRRVRSETAAIKTLARVTVPAAKFAAFMAAAQGAGMDEPAAPLDSDDEAQTVILTTPASLVDALQHAFPDRAVTYQLLPPPRQLARGAIRRDRLEPMLKKNGDILPDLLVPTHPRPAGLAADAAWYDGSKLQFLKPYQPFPYGLCPQAIGYDYYKRAQLLVLVAHETHLQTSDFVVDSRPGLELKFWGAQEGEQGRRAELRLFGIDDTGERSSLETRAPGARPSRPATAAELEHRPDPTALARAVYSYALAARVYRDSRTQLSEHLRRYPGKNDTFISHIEDDEAFESLYQADHDFLTGEKTSAADHYEQARQWIELIILRHYMPGEMVTRYYPRDPATGLRRTRDNIGELSAPLRRQLLNEVLANVDQFDKSSYDDYVSDRAEYVGYLYRCMGRLNSLGRRGNTSVQGPPAPGR